ncbi:MAG: restriction endonuclease subunit S [Pseudomonadota bacterium]
MSEAQTTKHAIDTKGALPAGWHWVNLWEVVDCFPGAWGQDSEFEDSTGVQIVGTSHISNEGLLNHNDAPIRYLSQREMLALCFAGDLLVVKSSGSAANIRSGKTAICPNELSGKIACANFLMRLAPRLHLVEPYLLWHFLNGEDAKEFVRRIAGSSTYPNIKWSSFRNLEIPLPPLSEQRQIAGVLREQMVAVDKARAAAQARLEAVKALPAAFLRQVFPQPGQSLPDGWRWVKLGEVIEVVSGQVDPKEPRYRDLPHVNGENIESGTGRLLTIRSAAEDRMTSGKYFFGSGVVLYSKLRPYLKKAAIADFRGLCSADMYPILPKHDELTLSFLLQILLSEPFTTYAESESQRARMPKLNRDQLFAYAAPLPHLPEQKQIAAIFREQMTVVEKARAAAQEELNTINALPAALLRRAFNGEL